MRDSLSDSLTVVILTAFMVGLVAGILLTLGGC